MNQPKKKTWFPARRYGYGWGPPNCWQGWVVMAAWLVLLLGGTIVLRPERHPAAYAIYGVLLTALFVVVVAAKGEKPRWRWDDDPDRDPGS